MEISVDEKVAIAQLHSRITSRMDVTKFFTGFVALVFGIILRDVIVDIAPGSTLNWWLISGISLIVFALGAAISALLAFDRLLMPIDMEAVDPSFKTEHAYLIFQMRRIWSIMFIAAIVAFFGSLVAFVFAHAATDLLPYFSVGLGSSLLATFILYKTHRAPHDEKRL